jgi:hypothetical protein
MASLSPSPEIPQFETIFVVRLDTYIKNSTESNGKTKVKEVKSTKIKKFVFHISTPNYLDFLTTMLMKYEKLSVFKVTAKKGTASSIFPEVSLDRRKSLLDRIVVRRIRR